MKQKRGQFLIITSLLMAIILASVIAYVYNSQTYYLHFRYEPVSEIIEAVTADFKRALAYVLANATHTYLNETYGSTARHNFTIGRLYAYDFLSKWKIYTMYAYKDIGLQVDFETPEKTIQLHDNRTRKIANLTKCYWYYPESLSIAYATLKLNITKYNFYGWKANITVGLRAWIIEDSFKSDKNTDTTSFMIQVLYDNNTQYPWLYEKGNITIWYPDPIEYGEWRIVKREDIRVQYLGNGIYNITIKPYLKLFQGTEHSVAPLKIKIEDERGIIVQLYSYKWIQLKITRNTPNTLWAYDDKGVEYTFDLLLGDQGWWGEEDSGSDKVDIYPRWIWTPFGSKDLGDSDPDGGLTAGNKLIFRFKKITSNSGYYYLSLYSPIIELSDFSKYNGEYIEDRFLEMDICTDAGYTSSSTEFKIYVQVLREDNSVEREVLLDTIKGRINWNHREYSLLPIISSGSYYGKIRIRIICNTSQYIWRRSDKWEIIQLDNVKIKKIKVWKTGDMPSEVYTLDFDWYLNLYWNGINLGLSDIVWDFERGLEGWFIVPQQPFKLTFKLLGHNITINYFAIDSFLSRSNINYQSGSYSLELKFKKIKDPLNYFSGKVWLNLYSPIININVERLDEYNELTLWYKVDSNPSKTNITIRIQTFNKIHDIITLDERQLTSTTGEQLSWNLKELLEDKDVGKIAGVWINVYAETTEDTDDQYLWIDNVTLTTKRALVVPIPSIPVKNFRVNISSSMVPCQFEIWNRVYWHGWNISLPEGLADFLVNYNSSIRTIFQLYFNYDEKEKNIKIWWEDDLDTQPVNWSSNLGYIVDEINKKLFVLTNKLRVQLIDERYPNVDKFSLNYNKVSAVLIEQRFPDDNVTIGIYDLHAFAGWSEGKYRPSGNWTILNIEYPAPYNNIRAPVRLLAKLETDLVSDLNGDTKDNYYSTVAIVEISDNVNYVPVLTRIYWLEDKKVTEDPLKGYWLYVISSRGSEYIPYHYEVMGYANSSKQGDFDDLSSLEYIEGVSVIHSQWNDKICLSSMLNFGTLRTAHIFSINTGYYCILFDPIITHSCLKKIKHPPPVALVRHSDKYSLEVQTKPTASLQYIGYVFLSVKKGSAFYFIPILFSHSKTEGGWVYSYLYTPMFLEPYMPTFNVTISSP